jgi:putative Ca2+/H+ antiporter (TMEM165/GDT1 family)
MKLDADIALHPMHLQNHPGANGGQVFASSLVMVGVAELFDKTWFMGLLLALKYKATTVFIGSYTALMLHTVLAAVFGYAFAKLLKPYVLDFLAAALFGIFFVLYMKDCIAADPDGDAIAAGKEEAGEEVGVNPDAEPGSGTPPASPSGKTQSRGELGVFLKAWIAVFIAEWGDRTQIAMIGQHASQPLIPVFLGSTVAFFLLTGSAVCVAKLLTNQKISERLIYGVSCIAFGVFTALALKDGIIALHHARHPTNITKVQ